MKKLLAIAICAIPFAVVPTVYAQSSTSSGSSTQAPSTAPTPKAESLGGTSASSGRQGTAGSTMGEGMKSHDKSKAPSATDSTEASKKIGGEPVDIAPKNATPPGTSAGDDKTGKDGKGNK